ncbi:MAG: ABC transporter ATP-binding protein [Deltaproteobacteria bacterium]|nr:ABC transporter ATP-binding protein [Deltaproteobacteria bacterium]MBW1848836.1 ABC transporter ATP-binding protein [Deltaproteobacteria bacterium]MBW2180832.1 ABC transporter ATP-binding protein [Deltaproteobacteria bacterium]
MPAILEVKNLVKKYATITAVNDVSFTVEQGACFALLGPNGAGKTTTIEVIEDVISATSGTIEYKGKPRSASFKDEIGIQFQETSLLSFLTVRETIETFQSFYQKTTSLQELTDLFNLEEFLDQGNDKLSGGQRQRFLMALALANQPEFLFLDEPSTGLDPQARRNLWNIVQQIKSKGKTIILTTHYMEEAQYLCDEIAIMDNGVIIAQGTSEELIKEYCGGITVVIPKKSFSLSLNNLSMKYREIQGRIEIQTNSINECLDQLLFLDIDLTDMTVRSPNLEDVFLNLTGKQLRE